MTDVPVRTEVLMGTLVTIHVVRPGTDDAGGYAGVGESDSF